jgi:hypothetical protein
MGKRTKKPLCQPRGTVQPEPEFVAFVGIDWAYGQEDAWYKVRADDGNVYILRHQTSVPDGIWNLVSLRKPT